MQANGIVEYLCGKQVPKYFVSPKTQHYCIDEK